MEVSPFRLLAYGLFAVYLSMATLEVYGLFYPERCRGEFCLRALLPVGTPIDVAAFVPWPDGDRVMVWNATLKSDEAIDTSFELPIPAAVRRAEMSELWLLVELRRAGDPTLLAIAHTELVKLYQPRTRGTAEYLLYPLLGSDGSRLDAEPGPPPAPVAGMAEYADGRVAHYLYLGKQIQLKLVADETPHAHAHLPEGLPVGSAVNGVLRVYAPHFYIETFSLMRKHAAPLSDDVARAHPTLRLSLAPISIGRHRLMAQLRGLFATLERVGGSLGLESEIDEIKELLDGDRIYRFALMQAIGFLHILFDIMAFRSDVGFWKGRETMRGLSSRSVISSAAQVQPSIVEYSIV